MAEQQMIEQLWELQTRQTELRRHVVQLSSQLTSAAKEREILDITVREMDRLPADTRTYRAIGKMFVLSNAKGLRTELVDIKTDSAKNDESRLALRDQFVAKLKDAEAQSEQLAATMQKSPAFRSVAN
jgi:chaperonin cofactor prefoldin